MAGKNSGRDIRIEPTMINGTVGALLYMDGEIDHSLSLTIDGDRIAAIYIVRNPDKLRHVRGLQPALSARRRRRASGYSTHGMSERLACKKRLEIGDHAVLHREMRFDGMAADMRGQHDVRKGGQRVGRMRLAFEHVKAGAGDGLVGQAP